MAYGAYSENGKSIENETLIYELCYLEYDEIEKIATEIRKELNTGKILIPGGSSNYELK